MDTDFPLDLFSEDPTGFTIRNDGFTANPDLGELTPDHVLDVIVLDDSEDPDPCQGTD